MKLLMVSDTDSNTEEENLQESSQTEDSSSNAEMEGETQVTEEKEAGRTESPTATKKAGGRRAALRIVREGVDGVSKDLATFRKAQDSSSKRLEKQIAALRSDIAALKSHVAKESAKLREKQDTALSRLLAKVSAPKASAKPSKVKKSGSTSGKSKKSKGKK